MDVGTIAGLVAGVALVLAAMQTTAGVDAFFDGPALLIVLGGSLCAALVSFPLRNLLGVARVMRHCFFARPREAGEVIKEFVAYAEVARRDGVLALEQVTGGIDDPFVVQGLQLVIDGTDREMIEAIMLSDVEAIDARHAEGKALFENIGRYAPAFGMIGTLVGLVLMLRNLNEPSAIGPAMAVALLTTLYGALIANVVALPLAEKLGRRSSEEIRLKQMVIRGVLAIQAGDHPRNVQKKLMTFLPNRLRNEDAESREAA